MDLSRERALAEVVSRRDKAALKAVELLTDFVSRSISDWGMPPV